MPGWSGEFNEATVRQVGSSEWRED